MNKSTDFRSFLEQVLNKDLLFACFSYPGSNKLHLILQKKSKILTSTEVDKKSASGFIFQPFDKNNDGVWIERDFYCTEQSFSPQEIIRAVNYSRQFNSQITPSFGQKSYLSAVESLIRSIKNKEAQKVVFSRSQQIKISRDEIVDSFLNLNRHHEDAFVFLINLPGKITWIGASPETLLKEYKGDCESMAMAATRPVSEVSENWNEKEIDEQAYVAEYIENVLSDENIDFKKSALQERILNSGVKHLCQNFSFTLPENESVWNIVYKLHPTPAVCGIPVKNSMDLIEKKENYDRSYYTGFLGPVNLDERTNLFVNLRSAQITENNACLYVGGGITADSSAVSEWKETELKAATILDALKLSID